MEKYTTNIEVNELKYNREKLYDKLRTYRRWQLFTQVNACFMIIIISLFMMFTSFTNVVEYGLVTLILLMGIDHVFDVFSDKIYREIETVQTEIDTYINE